MFPGCGCVLLLAWSPPGFDAVCVASANTRQGEQWVEREVWTLGLGLENKSPQIELLRSETSSSHHIMTISSSIAHNIKS